MINHNKLFHKDFTLVVIGQIISLFGNTILRFALPLYLLDQTGSAATFGAVLAFSMIPMALLSPIGGIISDRINRRNIMVTLDFTTAALVALFGGMLGAVDTTMIICGMLICLSTIQSLYQPSVQSSIPLLAAQNNLMRANAIINQVQSLSGLLGPILGGMLYGIWGLRPIIVISTLCFFLSAVMEIFIRIPFVRQSAESNILSIVKHDFSESMHFILKKQRVILGVTRVVAAFNLFLTSMVMVGFPYIIKVSLSLSPSISSQLYGFTEGAMGAGALAGGILLGIFANRLQPQNAHQLLAGMAFCNLPIVFSLFFGSAPLVSYYIITVCGFCMMALATMFTISMLSFVQTRTPNHLIGKVISYVVAISTCAQPLGQAMYGWLFKAADQKVWIVIAFAVVIGILIALAAKKTFQNIVSITPSISKVETQE